MFLILLSLTVILVFCFLLIANNEYGFIGGFVAPVIMVFTFIATLIYGFVAFDYMAAEHKASIINRECNANHTQLEVFYASDVIETVRELDKKRIELNGDLITGGK